MRLIWILIGTIGFSSAQALAQGRCHGAPSPIFCDDFDTYCIPPAGAGLACDGTGAADNTTLQSVWVTNPSCSVGGNAVYVINTSPGGAADSAPYTVRSNQKFPDVGTIGQQTVNLQSYCSTAFGNASLTAANGTDDTPLTLQFTLNTNTFKDAYMDLSLGNDAAPTDYVMGPDCSNSTACGGINTIAPPNNGPHAIICQQNLPPTFGGLCPPLASFPVHSSVAIGVLAHLDNNPCHCDTSGSHTPQFSHLAFFDGKEWWTLKTGAFPIVPTAVPNDANNGDFIVATTGTTFNRVILRVKTTTYEVELRSKAGSGSTIYGSAVIPRQYTGAFSKLRLGVGLGAELQPNAATPIPVGPVGCFPQKSNATGQPNVDTVLLYGGVGATETGACCRTPANGGCEIVSETQCAADGGTFRGINTTCATACNVACCPATYGGCTDIQFGDTCAGTAQALGTSCAVNGCPCHTPWADADSDGDVDQNDFGDFQRCWTGPTGTSVPAVCQCFNRVASVPSRIDQDDLDKFTNCFGRSGVAANPNCGQ